MFQKKFAFLKILLILILLIGLGGYFKYNSNLKKPVDKADDKTISFQIKKGSSATAVGQKLEEKDIINSSLTFYIYAKLNNLDEKIIAGRFKLSRSQTIPEILKIITDTSKAESVITIQEGLRIKDIDKKLYEDGLIKEGEFITATKDFINYDLYPFLDKDKQLSLPYPLEGYIFPDTYFFDPESFESQDLIFLSLDNFEKKYNTFKDQLGEKNLQDIINMASIIEKEVNNKIDREFVSGILWKRLANNWMLGADATLLYLKDTNKISDNDLQSQNPYNTRTIKGLPQGPICNPGLESITASLNPKDSEYWFYLNAKADGKTIYAITNEEQNQNIQKYLY